MVASRNQVMFTRVQMGRRAATAPLVTMRTMWRWCRCLPLRNRLTVAIAILIALGIVTALLRAARRPMEAARCEFGIMRVVASTDRESYGPGEDIILNVTARNASSEPCRYWMSRFEYTVQTASGTSLAGGASTGSKVTADPLTLAPNQVLTAGGRWDQRDCLAGPDRCSRAAAGDYLIRVLWAFDETSIEAASSFRLVATS